MPDTEASLKDMVMLLLDNQRIMKRDISELKALPRNNQDQSVHAQVEQLRTEKEQLVQELASVKRSHELLKRAHQATFESPGKRKRPPETIEVASLHKDATVSIPITCPHALSPHPYDSPMATQQLHAKQASPEHSQMMDGIIAANDTSPNASLSSRAKKPPPKTLFDNRALSKETAASTKDITVSSELIIL